ncbi:MAG: hypothetical protein LBE98_02435 [Puniceicoccales bacterium]|jgi:hypothetical protein|nr:hypothetical protein [Puniceicoccales bacterium]
MPDYYSLEYVSDEFLRFHPAMTTSGSMQITGLVGDCMACSGTVWNHKTWPTELDEGLKEDVGTEGRILIKQKQDFKAGRAKTLVSESAEVESVLDTISDRSDLQNFRALIDTGGIFKTSNAETVARKMLAWIEGKNASRADNKIDIQGVSFFKPYEDRAGGAYCIMSADGTIHVLSGTTKDDIQKAGFHPDKIAAYYDEARTVGTDVKFRPTAFALQTYDPSSSSLRDLSQGSMRMRQLSEGQCVCIVCVKSHVEAKRKAEREDDKTVDAFDFEEVLKWAIENQAKKLKKQKMKAYKAKIDGILKDIVLEVMQDKETKYEDACNIYNAFISFFQREMQTDAIRMFTADKTIRDGADEIESYYADKLRKFSDIVEAHQNWPTVRKIKSLLDEAQGPNGKLIKTVETARNDLKGEKFETNEHIFDADVDQEREQEQEQQTEINQEREQNVDQEREQDVDLNYQGNAANRRIRKEENIDVSIDESSTSFAHFKSFESVSAEEDLRGIQTNRKFTSGPIIQNYGELLPNNFRVSRNFREVVEGDIHPLSPFRKEPTFFVLHIAPDGKHEFCVVSNGEAKTLKRDLGDENTFLFDIHGSLIKGNPTKAETLNDQRDDAINWIHFWHGDVEALQLASSAWINKNLRRPDPRNPTEHSNHEICCFRWLLSRSSHGNSERADHIAKEIYRIFQSAGVGRELQAEAEGLFAALGIFTSAPAPVDPVEAPAKTFKQIINEIPLRRNAPSFNKISAATLAFFRGTSIDVELAKEEVKIPSQEGDQRIITIGKRSFKDIQDKRSFLQDASNYIRSICNVNPEEARRDIEFLMYFCKEYLSSSKDNIEVASLKTMIASLFLSLTGISTFVGNAKLTEIFMKICAPRK